MSRGDHSVLAPSASERWVKCAGSRALEAAYPSLPNEKSEEGDIAHSVACHLAQGVSVSNATDEMQEGAEMWVDALPKGLNWHLEETVSIKSVHGECFGTPDCWAYDHTIKALHVLDYKFGHRFVEVFENTQLILYALGVIENHPECFGFNWNNSPDKIVFTIVQPRSYHRDGPVRSWTAYMPTMAKWLEIMRDAAEKAILGSAPTISGEHCRNCSARRVCPTLQASAYHAVEYSGDNTPFDLPSGQIGRELVTLRSALALLSARESGIAAEVLQRVKTGEVVPGWMTEQGMGREKWIAPLEEIVALGDMMGVKVSKPGAITPKQAIKAGLDPALVAQYSTTPVGEVNLVRDDGSKSRKVFGDK